MFVLAEKRIVQWPVKVSTAKDGKPAEQTFEATWNIPDIDAISEGVGDGRDILKLRAFLTEHLIGWSDIQDPEGNAVPYSEEAKAALLRWSDALDALSTSFTEAVTGGKTRTWH